MTGDIQQDADLMRRLQRLLETTEDRSPERIAATKELVEEYKTKMVQEGKEGEELTKEVKRFRQQVRRELKDLKSTDISEFVIAPIGKLKLKDESKINIDKDTLFEERLDVFTIGDLSQVKILEPEYMNTVNTWMSNAITKEKYGQDKLDTLQYNIERIQTVLKRKISQSQSKAKMKTVRFNVSKYLGATPLSSATQREDIYEFWEEVADKYETFKEDLDAVFDAADNSKNEEFKNHFSKIRDKYGDENLEYIARFPHVALKQLKPVERVVAALENLLMVKGLADKKMSLRNEGAEDDVDSSGADEWETEYLEAWNGVEAAHRDDGFLEEELAVDSMEDIQELTIDEENVIVDPLLAYEVMTGKKLLAFTQDAKREMRQMLDDLKEEATVLDFQTDIKEMMKDIEDSFISEKGEFFLPISVLKNTKYKTFGNFSDTLPSAIEIGTGISIDIEDTLTDLLEDIHKGLVNKKFGFAQDVRTTGRGGTLGSVSGAEAGFAREAPRTDGGSYKERMGQLFGARSRPINPLGRGKLDESLEEFKGVIAKFIESTTEYYINPMYSGRLPIETPSFISGRGASALSVLAKDMELETVMGGAYELLSSVGATSVSSSDLREIADFLEFLDRPNFKITDELIQAADEAADALSNIFGEATEKSNSDYMGALLYHFMQEMEDMTYADETINGESVKDRADSFETGYGKREAFPIFALPHFLDRHQSLLTKQSAMKTQYNRLKKLFTKVEDDLPIVLNKLLKAHDAIRKQLGKKVEYGFMKLEHDSVDSMINKMYVEESIDLSHLEVENIVKSDDSHNNISKEYGINTEQVYLIKANFR